MENQIYSARMRWKGAPPAKTLSTSSRAQNDDSNILILELTPQDFQAFKRLYSDPEIAGLTNSPNGASLLAATSGPAADDRLSALRDLLLWDPVVFSKVLERLLILNPDAAVVTWHIPRQVVDSSANTALESLARNPKIIWSSQFDPEGEFAVAPATLATHGANIGYNNLFPDSDGVIRRGYLERRGHPSVTWIGYRRSEPAPYVGIHPAEPFLINYAGPPGTIPTCSLRDVMQTSSFGPCGNLTGKTVLLSRAGMASPEDAGSASGGLDSLFRTPFGPMTRSEILANELLTLRGQKFIHRASSWSMVLMILTTILMAGFFIIYYPVRVSAIGVGGGGVAVLLIGAQVLLATFNFYLPTANLTLAFLISYLVFTGYRLAAQENQQWRSVAQAQYLQELDQLKTNFLSLMSHDLKTPIAKIHAMIERLRRDARIPRDAKEIHDAIESIEHSNQELMHHINSILSLSRIESQKTILKHKSNDINRIIQGTIKRLKPLATSKGIVLEEQLEPLFSVECDEDLIRQVLTNLIDNAIRYSPAGSRVVLRSEEEGNSVRVSVADSGPGIAHHNLPLMFRKFTRFAEDQHTKGSGLGLYLSKYFIELHHGTLQVKSEEGSGSTFSFTLPLALDVTENPQNPGLLMPADRDPGVQKSTERLGTQNGTRSL